LVFDDALERPDIVKIDAEGAEFNDSAGA